VIRLPKCQLGTARAYGEHADSVIQPEGAPDHFCYGHSI
jgi:hypothetical protein